MFIEVWHPYTITALGAKNGIKHIGKNNQNILNWQKDGQDNIEDYQHNHVLRTVLMDEELSNSSNYIAGQQIETLINYDLAALEQYNIDYSTNNTAELGNGNAGDWNASNMSIIAYLYNTTTKEIVQVEESHLNN